MRGIKHSSYLPNQFCSSEPSAQLLLLPSESSAVTVDVQHLCYNNHVGDKFLK
jgi:hypothetical protein